MDIDELVSTARDSMSVRRVYGETVERDGVAVIPVATIAGGLGAGTGQDPHGQQGEGGGFGMTARPSGAFVIADGQVSWVPAVDVNKLLALLTVVTVVGMLLRARRARLRDSRARPTDANETPAREGRTKGRRTWHQPTTATRSAT
jgi:uncharacterized spore protein YtfJ